LLKNNKPVFLPVRVNKNLLKKGKIMETTFQNLAITESGTISKSNQWIGHVLSAIAVLFMLFDGVVHFLKFSFVIDAFNKLGVPIELAVIIGTLELICLALYVIPGTSIFGAILLTGYLGGATLAQLRIGEPILSNTLFPVYMGILLWGGLYLRDKKLRNLIPLRTGKLE
jgi:hypothetical protein